MKRISQSMALVLAVAGAPLGAAQAQYSTETNPLTDETKHFLIVQSSNTVSNSIGAQKKVPFIVRCIDGRKGSTEFFLSTPTYNADHTGVDVRWGGGAAESQWWNRGTGGTAYFSKTGFAFLQKATQNDSLVLAWNPYSSTQRAAKFDLASNRADLQKMVKLCGGAI